MTDALYGRTQVYVRSSGSGLECAPSVWGCWLLFLGDGEISRDDCEIDTQVAF
ncbi:unnamed protein product [Periconia digitata]|uniref:Uncharacterized protein n=1 Tax=Periconia digitata TaxID=1303443 RepID=A0A9W4XPR5_9PLEO|nr:unnamed protein product [Periconia digitata]